MKTSTAAVICFLVGILSLTYLSCFSLRGSEGGGETKFKPPRRIDLSDIALTSGYKIEVAAEGLTFPSGVTTDDEGIPYVLEAGYSYGEAWTVPRLLKIESGGRLTEIVSGTNNGPWNGVEYYQGSFYIAEGGQREGGKILRVTPDRKISALVEGLPSQADHHTNGPTIGPDGYLYFGQGTATNSAVIGEDNAKFGWLSRHPDYAETSCKDIELTGENFETPNILGPDKADKVTTGAYMPFGKPSSKGQLIRGKIPCNGAVFRMPLAGGGPELFAWGFRNPFGLDFSADGKLYITENGFDVRGSRPVFGAGDHLYRVDPGVWYGWPDYSGGRPLTEGRFKAPGKNQPKFVLATHPNTPPKPAAILGVHSSADGFDFSTSESFGYVGQAFIALFGDMAPGVGKVLSPVGFKVIRVDVHRGVVEEFAVNKGKTNGPASWIGRAGLERPVDAQFDRTGTALYVVDFGVMTIGEEPEPHTKTGVLWKITRSL